MSLQAVFPLRHFPLRHVPWLILVAVQLATPAAGERVDYQQTIQPIFSEHCFKCHGPDEGIRKADLRLDLQSEAVGEGGVITAGSPDESELVRRITSEDAADLMPPPDANNPLSSTQIEQLRQWVQEGAHYTQHWAFVPPQRAELPDVQGGPWRDKHAIDRFVSARLRREDLTPSPPARTEVLCRRIHLDLVGLPPSPEEIDEFVDAARSDVDAAVATRVNKLLESPHFGEKWASPWLDVARYADTNGYEKDLKRDQWAWRDWIIQAINKDMPYDQFLIEQLAGDLLPAATQDQIVATGFLRNSMINEEGAIVPEKFRMDAMFDRMDCLGKAILGLTLQCAQCHNHKFDPITQDEYYGVFAFLNDTHDSRVPVYSSEQLAKIRRIEEDVQRVKDQIKSERPDWQSRIDEWVSDQSRSLDDWRILKTFDETWEGGLNHPEILADHSVLILGHPTSLGKLYVRAEPDLSGVTGMRLEALTYSDLPQNGPGRNPIGVFALSELSVTAKPPESEVWLPVPLHKATTDFSSPDQDLAAIPGADREEDDKRRVGPVAFLIDGKEETAWYPDRGPGRRNTASAAVIQFKTPLDFPAGTQLQVNFVYSHDTRSGSEGMLVLGRFRLALTKIPQPVAPSHDHAGTLALHKPAGQRTTQDRDAIFMAWCQTAPEYAAIHEQIVNLYSDFPVNPPTTVLGLQARSPDLHRETYALDRGDWTKPLHEVEPHGLSALHPLGETTEPARLAFARWIASRESPLAARVQVNRVWQAIFGTGLVETAEDFGTRATRPEYQELLDWLAVDFMDHGWSRKRLLRMIVSSGTYQQSSRVKPKAFELDPRNRLLARGPRFRGNAEVVRDIALTVSGLLSPEAGGPSVYPPVPESVLKFNFTYPDYWVVANGTERYRRGCYVFRKRSMPDPVLSVFDAPNGDTSCARRVRSNTPLAALASLNEPIFVEAARALALRILQEGGPTDLHRADYAYRLCTGRGAEPDEQAEVLALLASQRERLADGWLSINELATGDPARRPTVPADATPQDAAAWVIVSRVMLNLDESLSKN